MKRALALLTLALCGPLADAADPPPILQGMLDAARTLTYRGHVVQIEGTQAQTLYLLHRAGEDAGEDRVHSLQGAYGELRRAGSKCKVAQTDARQAHDEAVVAAAFPSLLPQRLVRLAQFYDFTPIGDGRLADRKVDFTLARPRDEFRFAYLLATDTATGLLMKASLIDQRGQVLRQVFLVNLELLPTLSDTEWQEPTRDAPRQLTWTEHSLDLAAAPVVLPWQVGTLPPGFGVSNYGRRRMPGGEHEIEQITVSDGLVSVSVFIDAHSATDSGLLGARRVAAVPAYGATVAGRHITVLGAAPFAALRTIADALVPTPPAADAQPTTLSSSPIEPQ